ncbi:putative leucine-rich repeat-containing protein DDB_G0290503 [Branchiostoma lanceolatum]|uniref:putative leucine-rich repeat-containing protein DDB_G0290503 n=1 Tax=Branchiostoma lanceolatum TaxID=7740 RepID=UPI0034521900
MEELEKKGTELRMNSRMREAKQTFNDLAQLADLCARQEEGEVGIQIKHLKRKSVQKEFQSSYDEGTLGQKVQEQFAQIVEENHDIVKVETDVKVVWKEEKDKSSEKEDRKGMKYNVFSFIIPGYDGTIKVSAKKLKLADDYVLEEGSEGAFECLCDYLVENPDELDVIIAYLNKIKVQVYDITRGCIELKFGCLTQESAVCLQEEDSGGRLSELFQELVSPFLKQFGLKSLVLDVRCTFSTDTTVGASPEQTAASQPAVYPPADGQTTSYTAISGQPTTTLPQTDTANTGIPEEKEVQEERFAFNSVWNKASNTPGLDRTTSVDNLMALPSPIRKVDHSTLRGLDLAMVGSESCTDAADDSSTLNFTVRQVQTALQRRSKKAQQQQRDVLKTAIADTEAMVRSLSKEITRLTQEDENAQKTLLEHKEKIQQLQETCKTKEAEVEKLTAENSKLTNQLPDLHEKVKSLIVKGRTSETVLLEKTLEIQLLQETNKDMAARMEELLSAKHFVEDKRQGRPLWKEKRASGTEERQSGPEKRLSPEETQSGPEEKQSGPEEKQSGPEEKQSGPEKKQSGPEEKQSGPEESGPEEKQTGPEKKQSGPEKKQSGPEEGQSGPEEKQSGPKEKQTGPEERLSGPEEKQSGPEKKQTGPEEKQSGPEKKQSGPEETQSGPEKNTGCKHVEERMQDTPEGACGDPQQHAEGLLNKVPLLERETSKMEIKIDDLGSKEQKIFQNFADKMKAMTDDQSPEEMIQTLHEEVGQHLDEEALMGQAYVRIGIIGVSGAGKSTFINSFRGLRATDPGAALVGTMETTTETAEYPHPIHKNVILVDFPGALFKLEGKWLRSVSFDTKEYTRKYAQKMKECDVFLIFTSDRVHDNVVWLGRTVKDMGKNVLFVRSKFDRDVEDKKRDRPAYFESGQVEGEERLLQMHRQDCVTKLETMGYGRADIGDVFIISGLMDNIQRGRWDAPALNEAILKQLDIQQKTLFIMTCQDYSATMVRAKAKIYKSQAWKVALGAAAGGIIPFAGAGVTIGTIWTLAVLFKKGFGLTEASVNKLATLTGKEAVELQRFVDDRLDLVKKIIQFFQGDIDQKSLQEAFVAAGVGGALAAAIAVDVTIDMAVPFIGGLVTAPVSFGLVWKALHLIIEQQEECALALHKYAFR